MKSIRSYGVHGALGLLMGIGPLALLFFGIGSLALSVLGMIIVFVIYGAYVGYISGGHRSSSRLAKLGVIAGSFCGIAASFLSEWILRRGDFSPQAAYPIILAIAGFIYGLPKFKNMLLLAASGAVGGAVGYGVYIFDENLIYYLNNIWMQGSFLILLIMLCLLLLAIGIAGASIAIGMYFIEGTAYTKKDIPRFLKITRTTGISLTILLLFVYSLMFISMAQYTSV